MNCKHILFLFCLCTSTSWCFGQQFLSKTEVGIHAGGMNYLGDLNNQSMLGRLNAGFGAFIRVNLDERWSVHIDANHGHVEGGNPWHLANVEGDANALRNLSFYSPIYEGSVRLEFNFVPFGTAGSQYHWSPYIFGGLGIFAFNPTAQYTNPLTGETQWYDLQPLGTEGQGTPTFPDRSAYTMIQTMMPFGIGFKVKPNKLLAFSIEYGFRKTWTDYIDDVSTTYVGSDLLNQYHADGIAAELADRSGEVTEGYVNAPGIKRGDDSLDDWYAYLNFSVSFRLDKVFWFVGKKKCNN